MKSTNALKMAVCLLFLFTLVQNLERNLLAQENSVADGLPTKSSVSKEARLILYYQYSDLVTTMCSPPEELSDAEKGQYVSECLYFWKKEILFMGDWFDKTIQDDDPEKAKTHADQFGLDTIIVSPSISMPPIILGHYKFFSQGARLGYSRGMEMARGWRKDISDENQKLEHEFDAKKMETKTRAEKISKRPQIEALLYLYRQIAPPRSTADPASKNEEASNAQTEDAKPGMRLH